MFKNLVISIMGSWMICNADFWIYEDGLDKFFVFFVSTITLFVVMTYLEDAAKTYLRSRYMKKWRVNQFKDVVKKNTPQNTWNQKYDDQIRTFADARRKRG